MINLDAVQAMHRLLRAFTQEQPERFEPGIDRIDDRVLFQRLCALQDVVEHLRLVTGMADAEAQAPEIRAAVRDHVAQAVVSTVSTALLEPRDSARQVEFVVDDEDLGHGRLDVVHQRANRKAAAVHVRLRLQHHQLGAFDDDLRDLALVA
jgi:hypothetical protein